MRVTDQAGGCRPTPLQERLLEAALLDGDRACEAWRAFRDADGLNRLDHGSYRMLPMLYRNLLRLAPDDPDLGRLRGVHRRAWYETRLMLKHMAPVLQLIHDAGMPTMLLKGAPLALLYYGDAGLRPMNDIDILVPEERAWEAIGLLEAAGWRRGPPWKGLRERDLRFRHSMSFDHPSGRQFDLHWHALYLACFRGADQPFLEASEAWEFEGIQTRALCPADQLIHTCAHGLLWNEIPPMRWVADAVTVMRTRKVDWQRLVELTEWLGVSLPMREGLEYLAGRFSAPVPEDVPAKLRLIKVSRGKRLNYERQQQAPDIMQGMRETVLALGSEYATMARGRTLGRKLLDVPQYLRFYWGLGTTAEVVSMAGRWVSRRFRLRLRSSVTPGGAIEGRIAGQ